MKENDNQQMQVPNAYGLPDDYFSSSSDALQNRLRWLEEHRDFPALRMAWRETGFAIPRDYFGQSEIELQEPTQLP
jgi:hypothetical protein